MTSGQSSGPKVGSGLDILVFNSGTPHQSLVLFFGNILILDLSALKASSALAGLSASRSGKFDLCSDLGLNLATVP